MSHEEITEAAVCLWEACLEHNYKHYAEFRKKFGAPETRARVISFAEQCHQAWEIAHPDDFDAPFDWEWCPAFMVYCVDDEFELLFRTPEAAAREILKYV